MKVQSKGFADGLMWDVYEREREKEVTDDCQAFVHVKLYKCN